MIIQIRGTSGSGKTTVFKQVMNRIGLWVPHHVEGRKQPLYYSHQNLLVLGHYESPCGGCDTIGSSGKIFELIQQLRKDYKEPDILCEGLLLSEDVKWSSQLVGLRVIFLTTPLERCLSQIKQRRLEVGNEKELNPKNTTNRMRVIERAHSKLTEAGIITRRASSDQAVGIILKWLGYEY